MSEPRDIIVDQIPRLRRYARALLHDRSLADDLVQGCLVRALANISYWKPGSDMRAWLFTIMHNLFVNECRKQNNQANRFLMDDVIDSAQSVEGPDQGLRVTEIESGLKALLPEQRDVILLVGLEGLSYQQVADILNIPKGTVMSRLHRGREQLRRWLDGEDMRVTGLRRVK
jgi:RNA polymerase sigma-70 factor (ECF subfamily)